MVTSYMTTAGTHYSTTKKRTAINHCLEIERLLQQIRISAAVPASMRGLLEADHIGWEQGESSAT